MVASQEQIDELKKYCSGVATEVEGGATFYAFAGIAPAAWLHAGNLRRGALAIAPGRLPVAPIFLGTRDEALHP